MELLEWLILHYTMFNNLHANVYYIWIIIYSKQSWLVLHLNQFLLVLDKAGQDQPDMTIKVFTVSRGKLNPKKS